MGKRALRGAPLAANPRKRQKIVHTAPTFEDVESSMQLRRLLAFDQDLAKARHGLQSFKVMLDGLSSSDQQDSPQWDILRQFLQSSNTRDGEDAYHIHLPDIMETWNFAAQMSNGDVLSAVAVVLALLLKVLSQVLDLRTQGLGICRTLLQKRQLELLGKNLSAEKGKGFIISPTLRLIREAISFDGGALSRSFFRARKYTYQSLARNMRIKFLGEGAEDPKRSSSRTNAVRLLLSSLRFLHPEAKRELMSERDVVAALVSSITEDPPYVVLEILDGLKSHVLMDKKLPLEVKGRILNSNTLSRLALLYAPRQNASGSQETRSVDEAVHEFLMLACTSPDAGVLRSETGLYPKGVDTSLAAFDKPGSGSDVSLDRIVWMDKFKDEIPVSNAALSELLQSLRPWTSTKQSELIISIFRAAPELIANYFLSKKSFTFDPKLSATWIGYAALVFSSVQLPLPAFFGNKLEYSPVPPPISIIMDNILPVTLSQKVLVRCLSQDSKLISFFATRLLVVALQKLEAALDMIREAASTSGSIWSDAGRRLVAEFCQRCPSLKYVTGTLRGIPEDDVLFREAATRLLRLYYVVIPQVALLAKFDVAPFLVSSIKRLDRESDSPQDRALSLVALQHLLEVAKASPGMRWFANAEELALSPLTALVRVYTNAPEGVPLESLAEILALIATEHEIFLSTSEGHTLQHLLDTIQELHTAALITSDSEFWGFLNNCLHRCATAPLRYIGEGIDIASEIEPRQWHSDMPAPSVMSPLTMTFLEQLPFITPSADAATLTVLSTFVSVYVRVARLAGCDERLLDIVLQKAGATFPGGSLLSIPKHVKLKLKLKLRPKEPKHILATQAESSTTEGGSPEPKTTTTQTPDNPVDEILHALAAESILPELENSALVKWTSKSVDDLVEEGFASSLVMLLSSPHISIRKEALTNIFKMAAKIKESTYEEKDQVWLLLSELAESSRGYIDKGPILGPIVAFTCHALDVLKNPLHCLYDKVNTFLTRGPVWSLDKIPLIHEILQEEPSRDDTFYSSLAWLLAYLLDALRTPSDLALFHRRRVHERVLALTSNNYMRLPLRLAVLRIVYRTTCIEGGSTTLVTRFGVLSWLESQMSQRSASSNAESEIFRALRQRVWETCDHQRINDWSNGGVAVVFTDEKKGEGEGVMDIENS